MYTLSSLMHICLKVFEVGESALTLYEYSQVFSAAVGC
jgi:hypothetical protein